MLKILITLILFSATIIAQWSDTTSVILLKFDEPMNIEGLLIPGNYSVKQTDNNKNIAIYRVGLVNTYKDSLGNIVQGDTSMVVLVTQRLAYKKTYEITANNLRDKAGNLINQNHKTVWYYNKGYAPEKFNNNNLNFSK